LNEAPQPLPSPGDVLTNEEISRRFAVGNMGGMRRSKKRSLLVIIYDPFEDLHQNRWEGDVLHYTGMGAIGDQSLSLRKTERSTNLQLPKFRCTCSKLWSP
jgi:5-methylcytosine-specific restriction protein A